MAARLSPLVVVEALALAAWLALMGVILSKDDVGGAVRPIDSEALASGTLDEAWMGIYFQGQKVGYSVTSQSVTADGGTLLRSRSAFELAAFGELKTVVTASNAVLDAEGKVKAFDFFMDSSPVRITARGEVRPGLIVIDLVQAGEVQTLELPVDEPPQMSLSLQPWLAQHSAEIQVGDRFELPYFDPVTLMQQTMHLEVTGVEVLDNAEEAYWITRSFGDLETRVLMKPNGETLREEGALGMSLVRETREEALTMPESREPVDIIGMSVAKLENGWLDDARAMKDLELVVTGVEATRLLHAPPLQEVHGDRVSVHIPREIPVGIPKREEDPAFAEYLASTTFIPVDHRDIQAKAEQILGDDQDRRIATKRLVDWVYDYLTKSPTIGVPNALEVLRVGQGDCNEHTSLFVGLARAQGIPSRITAGLVWSDRIGGGGFYYHAWPEVWFGEETGWVPVDPTFGQFPADATHLALVHGDLDKQIEIMGVMGRIGFRKVEE